MLKGGDIPIGEGQLPMCVVFIVLGPLAKSSSQPFYPAAAPVAQRAKQAQPKRELTTNDKAFWEAVFNY